MAISKTNNQPIFIRLGPVLTVELERHFAEEYDARGLRRPNRSDVLRQLIELGLQVRKPQEKQERRRRAG